MAWPKGNAASLYDSDFFEWTARNAELLRAGRFEEADMEHIAEEIEDMGKRERRELSSRTAVLMAHLLKWQVQVARRSRSGQAAISVQRRELAGLLEEMPSLRPALVARLPRIYEGAVDLAIRQTGLPCESFPAACPFDLQTILDPNWLPD